MHPGYSWHREAHSSRVSTTLYFSRRGGEVTGQPLVAPKLTKDRLLFEASGGRAAERLEDPHRFTDLEDIYRHWDRLIPDAQRPLLEDMVHHLAACAERGEVDERAEMERAMNKMRRLFRDRMASGVVPKKSQLLHVYNALKARGALREVPQLERHLVKKASKSQSGVLVITVLTSPYPETGGRRQRFSCQWNCYYCPNQPGQPRSYLHDEPAVMRANNSDFDAAMQFHDRAGTLAQNGHPVDKVELLILGGTWASYPEDYQRTFIRDLFWSANTFWDRPEDKRPRLDLEVEQRLNERASCKIIGVTLETRPDCINEGEIRRFREFGCTRVQLGIQHTHRDILELVNRQAFREDAVRALRLLKDNCFKIDLHLMPDLPGATPEKDKDMFSDVLYHPDLQADQWKIYPCEITPWTVIKKWFDEGRYVPYGHDMLVEVLRWTKIRVHPWIRLNRVVRDIPNQYIYGGAVTKPNMREDVLRKMREAGECCRCIRCREVQGKNVREEDVELVERRYAASGGWEHFLSFETRDRATILGFLRLRLPPRPAHGARYGGPAASSDGLYHPRTSEDAMEVEGGGEGEGEGEAFIFPELKGAALVRELHVYGQLIATSESGTHAQHIGLGRRLMKRAEEIAEQQLYSSVAVISGVGARAYYERLGYAFRGEAEGAPGRFMHKRLAAPGGALWSLRGLRRRAAGAPRAVLGAFASLRTRLKF